jgi:hypothetical protein
MGLPTGRSGTSLALQEWAGVRMPNHPDAH